MDAEKALKVASTCALCPGVCTPSCPVHRVLRGKETSPQGIGRTAFLWLKGWLSTPLSVYECSMCWRCVEACPVENPLPALVAWARKRLEEVPGTREALERETVEAGGGVVLVLSKPGAALAERVLGVEPRPAYNTLKLLLSGAVREVLDTLAELGRVIYTDAPCLARQAEKLGVDVEFILLSFKAPSTPLRHGSYSLHIPCWARGDALFVENASRIYGSAPERVLRDTCGAALYRGRGAPWKPLLEGGGVLLTYCGPLAERLERERVRAWLVGQAVT